VSKNESRSYLKDGQLLVVEHLAVQLNGLTLVRDVSLRVAKGSIHCLVGDSGSGKTLTSLATVGLLPGGAEPTGSIRLAGCTDDLLTMDQRLWADVRGSRIGYVGQNALSCLHPAYSIGFQVTEAIRRHQNVSRTEAKTMAVDALAAVDLANPEQVAAFRPAQLSGGMCQRVALAIALCNRPAVLIADEPTTALDDETQAHIFQLIRSQVADDGLGVLLITHDQDVVAEMADDVTSIRDGVSSPSSTGMSKTSTALQVREPLEPSTCSEQPALAISQVSMTYGRTGRFRRERSETLRNVTLSATAGATIGLVGRSGAGKTTLARIAAGILEPTEGEVAIGGVCVAGKDRADRLQRAGLVQYVFQDPFGSLNPRRTAVAQVADVLVAAGTKKDEANTRARTMLADVGLTPAQIDRRPTQLSGGQCQRVGIARALIRSPNVVVLDEPVSALDWSIRAEILSVLADLQDKTGATYLLIAHDRLLIEQQCDEIYEVADNTIRKV
jgi:peptide/nickel transport system ATP-binding protein